MKDRITSMRKFVLLLILALMCSSPLMAQTPASPAGASPVGESGENPAIVLLQSEIGGEMKSGTGVIAQSSQDTSIVITSYEAVKGAATIHVLVNGQGLVNAMLLKFAPEANLATLSVPVGGLTPAKLGDSDLLRPKTPITMTTATAIMEGNIATGMGTVTRKGTMQSMIPRPTGPVARLNFMPPTTDASTGAAIMNPASGEVLAIALSFELSQIDTLRFAIPINLVGALDKTLVNAEQVVAIKVLDGAQAPVLEVDPSKRKDQQGDDLTGYIIAIGLGVVIIGVAAFFMLRKKKAQVAPFSILPRLPEGQNFAFVTADGKLLPMDQDAIKVGRAADNDWCFDDPSVSNFHAVVKKIRGSNGWEVEDKRSTNGTCVRDRKIGSGSTETIHPGTTVQFGRKVKVMLMTRNQSNQ